MSVEADAGEPVEDPDRQLACPTQIDREPERVDPDDPRVIPEKLCSHCFQDGEVPDDVENLLQPRHYSADLHLPLSYDGERCAFGPYDDYTSYKLLLKKMSVEQFDGIVDGELTVEEVKRDLGLDNGGSD